jgi:hypothetical protein
MPTDDPASRRIQAELDDSRARNVALADALARTRAVADLQAQADAERTAVIEHLLAAGSAAERADKLRSSALTELGEATAAFSRAGHAGALGAEADTS